MSEWISKSIDDLKSSSKNAIAMGPFGSRITKDNFVSDGVPVIRGGNLNADRFNGDDFVFLTEQKADELRASNAYPLDIIITHRGTLGQVGIVPNDRAYPRYVVSQSQLKITIDQSKADPHFIFYFLRSPDGQFQLLANTSQTGVPSIASPTKSVKDIRLSLPPLDEQHAIAHVLGTLDDKIELNRRMNETLEGIARALFKSWFIDFDPVRAKAEGRQPFGMDEETAALFPDQFEDSELGEIPKGWRTCKLSDICTTQYGYTASAEQCPVGPKLLRVTDINKTDHIIWNDVPHCEIQDELLEKYKLAKGDLLVARMADPGKAAIIDDDTDAIFASYLVRLRTDSLACNYYVHGFLKSSIYRQYAEEVKGGSVQANMNAKVIIGCPIVLPSSSIIECYYRTILRIREKITSNLAVNSTLNSLRDSLLPKLISGDIRVDPSKFGFKSVQEKVGEV